MTQCPNPNELADVFLAYLKKQISDHSIRLGLAALICGDGPDVRTRMAYLRQDCDRCGVYLEAYTLPATLAEQGLIQLLPLLVQREDLQGIYLSPQIEGLSILAEKDLCAYPISLPGELQSLMDTCPSSKTLSITPDDSTPLGRAVLLCALYSASAGTAVKPIP